jgi:hypothetical protein
MGRKSLIFGLCAALLSNCGNCEDHDCKPALTVFVEVVNSAGTNLFSEADPILQLDSVKVIAVHSNFTHSVPIDHYEMEGKTLFSFLPASTSVKEYIVQYSMRESDTLTFGDIVYAMGECCQSVKHYDLHVNHQPYCTDCKDEIITIIR